MRPGSVASLSVSTASTGLLCLSVGTHVHRGRSVTEVECVAATAHISHFVHDILIGLSGSKILYMSHFASGPILR